MNLEIEAERILDQFTDKVDVVIRELIEQKAQFAFPMAGYFFGWLDEAGNPITGRKGKKVRPALALLTYEAITGSPERAMLLAASIELIHNYSLIHDDVEDRDMERRGRPTLWRIWGDGIALTAGSALHMVAFQAIDGIPDLSASVHVRLQQLLVQTCLDLCYGQHWDISFEKLPTVSLEMYLNMIRGKTGALIECCTHAAAILATDKADVITAYQNFGRALGAAFQVRDDFLNIWGDSAKFGKDTYSDLRKKKKSFPVTYTLDSLTGTDREKLAAIYADTAHEMTDAEIEYSLELIAKANAFEHTSDVLQQHVQEALGWLDKTGIDNDAQTQLRVLTNYFASRER